MGIFSTEGNLADLIDEFLDSPFMGDDQFAVPDFFAQALGRKGTAEDDFMRILGDVDEAADRPRPGRGKVKAATRPSISTPAALTATRPCASCSTNTWKASSPRECWS